MTFWGPKQYGRIKLKLCRKSQEPTTKAWNMENIANTDQ